MSKIISIFLPEFVWVNIEKLKRCEDEIDFKESAKKIIKDLYPHLLKIRRYECDFNFKYCETKKTIQLEIFSDV